MGREGVKTWGIILAVALFACCLWYGAAHVYNAGFSTGHQLGMTQGENKIFLVWKMGCYAGMTIELSEPVGLIHCGQVGKS